MAEPRFGPPRAKQQKPRFSRDPRMDVRAGPDERACPYLLQGNVECGLVCDGPSGEWCRHHEAQKEGKEGRVVARREAMTHIAETIRDDIATFLPPYLRETMQLLYDLQLRLINDDVSLAKVQTVCTVAKRLMEGEVLSMQIEDARMLDARLQAAEGNNIALLPPGRQAG